MLSKGTDDGCEIVLDRCTENEGEFLKGTYGRVGDGVNESQQGVQHLARFGDGDDGSFFKTSRIALRKGKHIVEERGRRSENATMNKEFLGRTFINRA